MESTPMTGRCGQKVTSVKISHTPVNCMSCLSSCPNIHVSAQPLQAIASVAVLKCATQCSDGQSDVSMQILKFPDPEAVAQAIRDLVSMPID